MKRYLAVCIATLSLLTGCATTYMPPDNKADLQAFAPAAISKGFDAKPVARFPVSIAAVRLQSGSYHSHQYTVITTREVEEPKHVARVQALPQISGVVGLNRMLLPAALHSDADLRAAAAKLHADMVFLYTFRTDFFDNDLSKPLSVITLGLSPTRKISATTTASALLLDTRTGYVYAAYETTKKDGTLATSWGSKDAAEGVRRDNERAAFAQLVDDFVASWPALVQRHGGAPR